MQANPLRKHSHIFSHIVCRCIYYCNYLQATTWYICALCVCMCRFTFSSCIHYQLIFTTFRFWNNAHLQLVQVSQPGFIVYLRPYWIHLISLTRIQKLPLTKGIVRHQNRKYSNLYRYKNCPYKKFGPISLKQNKLSLCRMCTKYKRLTVESTSREIAILEIGIHRYQSTTHITRLNYTFVASVIKTQVYKLPTLPVAFL